MLNSPSKLDPKKDAKQLSNSPRVQESESGEESPAFNPNKPAFKQYDAAPHPKLQKKLEYFYLPYNQ